MFPSCQLNLYLHQASSLSITLQGHYEDSQIGQCDSMIQQVRLQHEVPTSHSEEKKQVASNPKNSHF
jgi:hypothetical protein